MTRPHSLIVSLILALLVLLTPSTLRSSGQSRQEKLIDSIRRGDIEEVRQLLAAGASVKSDKPLNPLVVAVEYNRLEIARLLIDAGSDVDFKRGLRMGGTPLQIAASGGYVGMVRLLLAAGADVDIHGGYRPSPLHVAIGPASAPENRAVVRLLIEQGADVNSLDKNEDAFRSPGCEATPLQKATFAADVETVALLIVHGADVGAKDGNGQTALECAQERLEIIADVVRADLGPRIERVVELLSHPDIAGQTLIDLSQTLTRAVQDEDLAKARALLDGSASERVETQDKDIALQVAVARGLDDFSTLLLHHGADPNQRTPDGRPLLLVAVGDAEPALAESLLEYGADPDTKSPPGRGWNERSALHFAVDCASCVEVLLEHGADPDPQDRFGYTPLMLAAKTNQARVVRLLLEAGADPRLTDQNGDTAESLAAFVESSDEIVDMLRKQRMGSRSDTSGIRKTESGAVPSDILSLEKMMASFPDPRRPFDPEATPGGALSEVELAEASKRLAQLLEQQPGSIDTLILKARIDQVLDERRRIAGELGLGSDESADSQHRDPGLLLDRALQLQPTSAQAHYWKGRFLSERFTRGDLGLGLETEYRDRAIGHMTKAVELAPKEEGYRESLSILLAERGNFAEARNVLEPVDNNDLALALLDDLQHIPVPENAVLLIQHVVAQSVYLRLAGAGIVSDMALRVRIYELGSTTSKLEDFYREHWPGFRFFREASPGGIQYIRFDGENVVPASTRPESPDTPNGGVTMLVVEIPAEDGVAGVMAQPGSGESLCYLIFANFRQAN